MEIEESVKPRRRAKVTIRRVSLLDNHIAGYDNRLQFGGLLRWTALLRSPRYAPGISVLANSKFFCVSVRVLFAYFSLPRT